MDRIDEILFLYEDDTVEMADGGPITANKIPLKPANKNINKKGQPDTTMVKMAVGGVAKAIAKRFLGGKQAQLKGTEASRTFFKNRPVDKPTPTFEGPAGKAKVTNVKFKNPTQEKEYIKILEDRFKFPKGSKEAKKVATNPDIAKKFGITLNNVERVNKALINKLGLKYPTQTYKGREKIVRARDKIRKENIRKISSPAMEQKIKRNIKKVDPDALAKEVDLAHRASLKANANLGADYLTTSLGLDRKIVNQEIVRPIEQKLGTLYKNQKKLIQGLKPGKISKEKQKQIEKINIKISELSDRTKGTLQGVLVDEQTLKPYVYGKDYSKTLGMGLVDKPVKDLTQADLDIIKLNIPEQIKRAMQLDISPIPSFAGGGYLAGGLKKLGRKYKGSTLEALLENPKLVGSELGYEGLNELMNLLQGSGLFADGGIASLPGVKSGPPPESGPNPQGLENVKYYVTNT